MDKKMSPTDCKEFNKCMEILELMLDNEASKDEAEYVNMHMEKCLVCFEHYQVEKEIRELIKTKLSNLPVPTDLAHQIRSQIQFTQR
jgi:anti-sigma factor (TIGR02949 family)